MSVQFSVMTIGKLSDVCGVPAPTIRYYEQIALLPKAERSQSAQRRYSQTDVDRLHFIRRCRAFGFSIKQVRSLLAVPNGTVNDCNASKDIALARIDDIKTKVADLLALEQELKAVIDQCQSSCGGQDDLICGAFVEMKTP